MTEVYAHQHHYSSSPNPEAYATSRFADECGPPSSPFTPGDEELDVDASFASSMSITSSSNDRNDTTYQSPSVSPRSPYFPARQLASPMDISPAFSMRQPMPQQPHFVVPSRPPPPPPTFTSNPSSSASSASTSSSARPPAPTRPAFLRTSKENSFTSSSKRTAQTAALAQGRRSFGAELCANLESPLRAVGPTSKSPKGLMGPPALPSKGSPGKGTGKRAEAIRRSRAALPTQWPSNKAAGAGAEKRGGKLFGPQSDSRRESAPVFAVPKVPSSTVRPTTIDFTAAQEMDIDTDTEPDEPVTASAAGFSSIPVSPARFGLDGSGDFSEFFDASPSTAPAHKTTFGSPPDSPSSRRAPGGLAVSRSLHPGTNAFDRSFSAAPTLLFGASKASTVASRQKPYQRPPLAAFQSLPADDVSSASTSQVPTRLRPECSDSTLLGATFPRVQPPMRRAFSTCQPFGDGLTTPSGDEDSDASFFEDSPCQGGGAGANARRILGQNGPAANGSPSVRAPMGGKEIGRLRQGAEVMLGRKRSIKKGELDSPRMGEFGAEEKDGKVLPCHKVKEDGLMRISPSTLEDLMKGKYSSQVARYQIIDCRFGYEYDGGHIEGAVNIDNKEDIVKYLLTPGQGFHAENTSLPKPSTSTKPADGCVPGKTILVFHCEFSKARGPQTATTLRKKDRAVNQYPSLFYPEVYVLEGGYKTFFEQKPDSCFPRHYIPMDDEAHKDKRSVAINTFRKGKFARTQSYQGPTVASNSFFSDIAPPRPTSTNLPPLPFAAASAAQGKRGRGLTITESEEDDHADSSFASSDGGGGEGGSPCPGPFVSGGGMSKLRPRLLKMERAATSPFLSSGASARSGSMARF